MVEVDLGNKTPATLSLEIFEFIILVLMVEVELGLKRSANLPLAIIDKQLMMKVDMDIGLRPETLTRVYHELVVDC